MKSIVKINLYQKMTVAVRGDDLIGAMRVLKKRMQSEDNLQRNAREDIF